MFWKIVTQALHVLWAQGLSWGTAYALKQFIPAIEHYASPAVLISIGATIHGVYEGALHWLKVHEEAVVAAVKRWFKHGKA